MLPRLKRLYSHITGNKQGTFLELDAKPSNRSTIMFQLEHYTSATFKMRGNEPGAASVNCEASTLHLCHATPKKIVYFSRERLLSASTDCFSTIFKVRRQPFISFYFT